MTALAADRLTKTAVVGRRQLQVAAGVCIYEGSMVAIDTSGWARPARVSTTDKVIGVCEEGRADNTSGSNGAIRVTVRSDRGGYFNNSTSGDLIAVVNIGADCYVVDDNTVALTSNSSARVRAGKIYDVDPVTSQVLVRFDQ